MIKFYTVTLLFLFSLQLTAQELNCRIQINSQQIKGTNRQKFTSMRTSIYEFMNTSRWTTDIYSNEERIECNVIINLTSEVGANGYNGSITVKSTRPIYRASYNSPILNVIDNDFSFEYVENQSLEFNEHNHSSNLISILAYYAYVIIGMDSDTFTPLGGEDSFLKANKIINNAQSDNKAVGWKPYEGTFNRYWLVENLLHNDFKPLRNAMYGYHLEGLDILGDQAEAGRDEITAALYNVKSSADKKQNSYLLKVFFDAKATEITKIYSDGFITNKSELVQMLKQIDPANTGKWEKMLQEQGK
tara:strand:+ start:296 stop:1204 length:909 start_codon:yes stop_codon:yes gene_type:complete